MNEENRARIAEALERLKASPYDEEGWRALYHGFWPYVVAIAARSLGSYDDAVQDIAQDVFLRLLRAGPAADFDSPEALRAYLRMVTLSVVRSSLRELRRQSKLGAQAAEDELAGIPTISMTDEELQERDALNSVLSALGETDRQVVSYLMQGYSLREVAEALNVSYSTAGVRVHRLRRRLAKMLQQNSLRKARPGQRR